MRTHVTSRMAVVGFGATLALVVGQSTGSAASPGPSGQVMTGQATFDASSGEFVGGGATVEPAYDDSTGALVYLQTPVNAKVHPNAHNVAPIYLPVYPTGSTVGATAMLNCQHQPADNCPDHGPLIAGLAKSASPVYSNGVLGHDHLVGIASTGGDFNVLWEPVAVLFTAHAVIDGAINVHMTTLSQIRTAEANGDAFEIALPQATFHCSSVSAAVYAHGTPAPTLPAMP